MWLAHNVDGGDEAGRAGFLTEEEDGGEKEEKKSKAAEICRLFVPPICGGEISAELRFSFSPFDKAGAAPGRAYRPGLAKGSTGLRVPSVEPGSGHQMMDGAVRPWDPT